MSHGDGRSTVALEGGGQVAGSLVVDATGHSRKLVEYDKPFNPGGCHSGLVQFERWQRHGAAGHR